MLQVQGSRSSALPGDSQGPPCSLVSVDVICEWNQVTSPRTAWARPLAAELCEPAPPGPCSRVDTERPAASLGAEPTAP